MDRHGRNEYDCEEGCDDDDDDGGGGGADDGGGGGRGDGAASAIMTAERGAGDRLFNPDCAGLFLAPAANTAANRKLLSSQLDTIENGGLIRQIDPAALPSGGSPNVPGFTTGPQGLIYLVSGGAFFTGQVNGKPIGGFAAGMSLTDFQQLVIIHEFLQWEGIAGPDASGQKYNLPNGDTAKGSGGISKEIKKDCFQLKSNTLARILALIFLTGSPALASVLCVTVMDYARLPLPSASLNATNLLTGKAYLARSDKNGTACFSDIPEGLYSIEAGLTGFLRVKYYPVRVTSSAKEKLSFWLPFSEITEGGVDHESTLSGTLLSGGSPLESAEVCAIGAAGAPRTCTVTNDLGEYALVLTAGVYQTEVHTRDEKIYKSKIDVSIPGIYRNRLSLDANGAKP